jgi:hypothetical protein
LHGSPISLFQTLGDKGERAATVNFVQGEKNAGVEKKGGWWFGELSNGFR